MKPTIISALAMALTLVTPTAWAQSSATDAWGLIAKRHDKNGDGEVSAEEYSRGKEAFSRLDRNRDGVLSAADFEGVGRRRGGGRQGGMRRGLPWRMISRLADANGDRKVTGAEWSEFLGGLEIEDGQLLVPGFDGRRIRSLDHDGNGKLEKKDLEALFAAADADKSGSLEESELGRRGGRRGEGRQRPGQGRQPQAGLPQPGDVAPDFTLPYVGELENGEPKKTEKLSSYAGKKPVALIFGSYT